MWPDVRRIEEQVVGRGENNNQWKLEEQSRVLK